VQNLGVTHTHSHINTYMYRYNIWRECLILRFVSSTPVLYWLTSVFLYLPYIDYSHPSTAHYNSSAVSVVAAATSHICIRTLQSSSIATEAARRPPRRQNVSRVGNPERPRRSRSRRATAGGRITYILSTYRQSPN